MSRRCQVSQKKYNSANKISFSHKAHKHRQQPNLQVKRFWDAERKTWVKLRVSTKVIKTIGKVGLRAALKRYGADQAMLTK